MRRRSRAQMNEIVDVDIGFLLELGADARLAEIYRRQGDTAAVEHIHQRLNETGAIGLKVVAPASTGDDRRDL